MKGIFALSLFSSTLVEVAAFGSLCGQPRDAAARFPEPTTMPRDLKIAFLGDAGSGSEQRDVLRMVKSWGAEAVIHPGDFEYEDDAELFEEQLNDVLGPDFPYFASIGNHDVDAWTGSRGHQSRLVQRLERFGGDRNCTGEYGVNMACNWNGLFFVLSGVGTRGFSHDSFIDESLSTYPAVWKFVSWHKNQRLMQIGGKSDETGWSVYDTTREHGAILVTAHEHSYCRSHLMKDFQRQVIANTNETLNLTPGESFVFVTGLGGSSIRSWDSKLVSNPWWAAVAASNNGVSDGALLCTFNVGGVLRNANCIFKDRKGKVWDEFDIVSKNPATVEEHEAMLEARRQRKEEERAKHGAEACGSRWIEVAIGSTCSDYQAIGEEVQGCDREVVDLGAEGAVAFLKFENLPIKKGARIQHAYLQVYGAFTDGVAEGDFVIRGPAGGEVVWEKDDEEFERHTVWVSPDLRELVAEGLEERQGGSLLLTLKSGSSKKGFYSFDRSPCLAPTLAIELEDECQ